jgi:hypothetical protein
MYVPVGARRWWIGKFGLRADGARAANRHARHILVSGPCSIPKHDEIPITELATTLCFLIFADNL